MTGNNQLIINTATMIEIIQKWIDITFISDCENKVMDVQVSDRKTSPLFEISIKSEKTTGSHNG